MKRMLLLTAILAIAVISVQCFAQNAVLGKNVIVTKLARTTYPVAARSARIMGMVELQVTVHRSGTVDSVEVVSGHPILRTAAVESARNTQYQCEGCVGASASFRMKYVFVLNGCTSEAMVEQLPTEIKLSSDTVTVSSTTHCIDVTIYDPALVRVRSPKCFYLWKCGMRR